MSDGQNPGNADRMGISGVLSVGSKMALTVFCAVILRIIAEGSHNIFAASCTMFCVKYLDAMRTASRRAFEKAFC